MKIITEIAICNPMSCSGDNYRELLNGQGTLNLEPCLLSWNYNLTNLRNYMNTNTNTNTNTNFLYFDTY